MVTNRPVSTALKSAVDDARRGRDIRNPRELQKLADITCLESNALAAFCRLLHFEDSQEGYREQRDRLILEVGRFLAGPSFEASLRLKDLITRKASSEFANDPVISKEGLLLSLGTTEQQLFPAECQIETVRNAIPVQQEQELFSGILQAPGTPIIIHAPAGVGKTVFATRIERELPKGSVCILYDCFGNGQYRTRSQSRHRHRDGLVQIANELAARGLCFPLIPQHGTAAADYARAFKFRLHHATKFVKATNANALICIVIDAADNAQLAAEEFCENPSFVRDLLRESIPTGVRLVALCRSHRQHFLNPPVDAVRFELKPFSRTQTKIHLQQVYPDASIQDVDEFHRRTSQNPRVQAFALRQGNSLEQVFRNLGPGGESVEGLLDSALEKLRDEVSVEERKSLDKICFGIATLRPSIPISVLSRIANIEEADIRSFTVHPELNLLSDGQTLRFRDEPTETWFRDRFRLSQDDLGKFISRLTTMSSESLYVAFTLPQLLLEADQTGKLVELALSSEALPESGSLERHEVERQRIQFALKACLRSERYVEAAKLALMGGWREAGQSRRRSLLQDSTDLVATLFAIDIIQDLMSDWPGSSFLYEACLLSGIENQLGEARSRLRLAREWFRAQSQLPLDDRTHPKPSPTDVAQLAIAELNIHGADHAAKVIWTELKSFAIDSPVRPFSSSDVARIVASRLVDHGRFPCSA